MTELKSYPILAFDPSGAYHEGNGTTGYCLLWKGSIRSTGTIRATDYKNAMAYFQAHLKLIDKFKEVYPGMVVVMEDYILYANKAKSQIDSHMETCRLLGLLEYYCWEQQIPYGFQLATTVKKRWKDDILIHKGYELPVSQHTRDAVRHAVHHYHFGRNLKDGSKKRK